MEETQKFCALRAQLNGLTRIVGSQLSGRARNATPQTICFALDLAGCGGAEAVTVRNVPAERSNKRGSRRSDASTVDRVGVRPK